MRNRLTLCIVRGHGATSPALHRRTSSTRAPRRRPQRPTLPKQTRRGPNASLLRAAGELPNASDVPSSSALETLSFCAYVGLISKAPVARGGSNRSDGPPPARAH
ncbi:unnamed protein product, partial [Iphiclides podalirius]